MKKNYIIAIGLLTIFLLLAGNNYYQTWLYKSQKAADTKPAINQPSINQPDVSSSVAPEKKPEQRRLAVINIGGFDCPSCPVIAENALKDTKGMIDARTTSTGEASRVLYDASLVTIDDLRKVLGKGGMYTIDRIISDQPSQKEKLE